MYFEFLKLLNYCVIVLSMLYNKVSHEDHLCMPSNHFKQCRASLVMNKDTQQ